MEKVYFCYANSDSCCVENVQCQIKSKPTFCDGEKWVIMSGLHQGKVAEIGRTLFRSRRSANEGLIRLLRNKILDLQERITELVIESALESVEDRIHQLECQ